MIELNNNSRGGESRIRRDIKWDEVDVDDFEGGGGDGGGSGGQI